MIRDLESYVKRKVTRMMISSSPTRVSMIRGGAWARTTSGGMKRAGTPAPLPPKVRFFSDTGGTPRLVVSSEGQRVQATHVIIGEHDDDIQEGDEFIIGNRKYRVAYVDPNTSYQVKGFCVSHA